MDIISEDNFGLISLVKEDINDYCPYVENKNNYLDKAVLPQLEINIDIMKKQSQIEYMYGNIGFRNTDPERIIIKDVLDFEVIEEIIDYILHNNDYIQSINVNNKKIELKFGINNDRRINCGEIELNIEFDNKKLEKKYLLLILRKYYDYCKNNNNVKRLLKEKNTKK